MKVVKILIRFLAWTMGVLAILLIIGWFNREALFKWMGTRYFANLENKALAQAFNGVVTSEGKYMNLFPIKATGISTKAIQIAAENFLNSLSKADLEKVQFPIDDEEWRKWSNVDNGIYFRQGISLKEMNPDQKTLAFDLMQVSLSAKGLQLSKDIMKTDQTLKEIKNGSPDFDEELYFFTFMGEPATDEPWGWQLDGHHLVINYFVLGDQVVMSPVFMGAEPVITTTGRYQGNTLFQDEQNIGLQFMRSLPEALQQEAILSDRKEGNNLRTEAMKDNEILDYEGLQVSKLTDTLKSDLLNLIAQYVNNIREGHQQVKMEEVLTHLDETWFAWIGTTDEQAVFYYRIHSPVVLIEFDHQSPVGLPTKDRGPTRNHIHTVVRTPNGNDYGKDLLRQHLEQHHH